MAESTMFADLLAAQQEMPKLQKSAINPHFKNRYVPLEELLDTVLPILNKHHFVLLQRPTNVNGQPALTYELRHASGETSFIVDTMMLCASKDDPQGQGSAITYARRYSLMSLLGLTADVDDDAEATRKNGNGRAASAPSRAQRPEIASPSGPGPVCPAHGVAKLVPAGTSKKSGKPYGAFYSCEDKDCDAGDNGRNWTMFADKWQAQLQMARGGQEEEWDHNDLPHE